MSRDDSHPSADDPTARVEQPVPHDLQRLGTDLADGLHRLAVESGELERLVLAAGGADHLDHDTRLRLDQAHSNATAIVTTLARLGFG